MSALQFISHLLPKMFFSVTPASRHKKKQKKTPHKTIRMFSVSKNYLIMLVCL